jgi:hypothetical protein
MARKKRINEADLAAFLRQYGRKRQKGREPNDRDYDRKLAARVKRMRAEDADRLMRDPGEIDR